MFKNLEKDIFKVETGIKNLRQSLGYVLNNYDYHHKNDELTILQNKKQLLKEVATTCCEIKGNFEEFKQLMRETSSKSSIIENKMEETIQNFQLDPSVIVSSSSLAPRNQGKKIGKARNYFREQLTEMSQLLKLSHYLSRKIMDATIPKIPIVTRLSPNVIRVLGCNPGPMTLQGTNTYLIGTGEKRLLIDTGDVNISKYIENLKEVLASEKALINTIILTHWHHDHVGGVKDVLKHATGDCGVWKFPRIDAPDICPEIPSEIAVQKLENEQQFVVEGATVKVVYTPGHTTDHVIAVMNDGVVFSGDCILGEGTAVFEDLFEYMKSLNKILDLKPKLIYPGHGNIIKEPITKINYYIDHRNERERQIIEVFQQYPAKEFVELDLVKIIYKDTPEALWPAAAYNVEHHFAKLVKEGKLLEIKRGEERKWMWANKSSL